MKKVVQIVAVQLIVFAIMVLAACSGGKQSAVEGKLVDWNGKPVADVKITASQVQPIKGYEHAEAVTKADGTFRLRGLFPSSAYVLKPWSDKWNADAEASVTVETAPQGETSVLPKPMTITRVYSKSNPSLVADIATGDVARSTVEGKLVDGKGAPMAGVKIMALQAHPVKGYEKFENMTDANGSFHLPNLLAMSRYVLKPWSDKWTSKVTVSVISPMYHGDTVMLRKPMIIRFTASSNGVITDSRTGLEWYVGPDRDTIWGAASSWVKGLTVGGGGWRMPIRAELRGLYMKGVGECNIDPLFNLKACAVWSGETEGSSDAWYFSFYHGKERVSVMRNHPINEIRGFAVRSRR